MATDKTVYLVYSVEDGEQWSEYLEDILSKAKLSIKRLDMDSEGSLPSSFAKFRRGRVVILLASPCFLDAVHNGKITSLDMLVNQESTPDSSNLVILFLCGTEKTDFQGRLLSERFPGLGNWTVVEHNDPHQLTRSVDDMMKQVKAVAPPKPVIKKPVKSRSKTNFRLVPDKLPCEESTMVVLSFDDVIAESESSLQMHVEIVGEVDSDGEPETPVKAVVYWLNPHTGYFTAPPHRAGCATVKVFNKSRSVGTKTITYELTHSEATTGVIQLLVHQLSVLCDILLVRRELPTAEQVDAMLSEVFQYDSVAADVPILAYEKFLASYRYLQETGEKSELELPTPFHFAAKYGLSELTTRMLELPDAKFASSIPNRDDLYPEDLARAAQRGSLAAVLENFHEVGDGLTQLYAAYVNSSDKGKSAERSQTLYLDMTVKKNRNAKSDADDEDDDYEEVPKEAEELQKSKGNTLPAKLPSAKPVDANPPRGVAASRSNAPEATPSSKTGGSQQELIDILEQVKHKQLSMDEAELMFREWQMRYSSGKSPSFKNKQEQLAEMKKEVQRAKESSSSMLGSFISLFSNRYITKKKGKTATSELDTVDSGSEATKSDAASKSSVAAASAGIAAAAVTGNKMILSAPESDNRSSSSSYGSRDSTASRASNLSSSGIDADHLAFGDLQRVDEEQQSRSGQPAPPIPPRSRAPVAGGHLNDKCIEEEDDYLVLEAEDTYEPCDRQDSKRSRRVLPGQSSMPESSVPPPIVPRKQSCPDALREAKLATSPSFNETGQQSTDSVKRKPPPIKTRKQ